MITLHDNTCFVFDGNEERGTGAISLYAPHTRRASVITTTTTLASSRDKAVKLRGSGEMERAGGIRPAHAYVIITSYYVTNRFRWVGAFGGSASTCSGHGKSAPELISRRVRRTGLRTQRHYARTRAGGRMGGGERVWSAAKNGRHARRGRCGKTAAVFLN